MNKIYCEKITKSFTSVNKTSTILKDVDYTFFSENTYAIMGISGTGKSTLLHILSGLELPTSGSVFFNDQNINTFSPLDKQNYLLSSIGLIFQNAYLLSELSVIENVMLKGLISGISYENSEIDALELLSLVGLSGKEKNSPSMLSGGEQQRVAIARALFTKPKFLLADEPTAHLDEKTRNQILDLLLSCQKKWGLGLIIACHDPVIANAMDTKLTISDGSLSY